MRRCPAPLLRRAHRQLSATDVQLTTSRSRNKTTPSYVPPSTTASDSAATERPTAPSRKSSGTRWRPTPPSCPTWSAGRVTTAALRHGLCHLPPPAACSPPYAASPPASPPSGAQHRASCRTPPRSSSDVPHPWCRHHAMLFEAEHRPRSNAYSAVRSTYKEGRRRARLSSTATP